jgi:hypothetical protein
MTCFCSFVDHDIFMRHFGDGVGHQKDRLRQEVDTATEIDADSERNDDDIEELDEHEEEIDEDEESEGEELASESDDDGSDDGCDSNDLGYASFLDSRGLSPYRATVAVMVLVLSANSVRNTHGDVIQSVSTCNKLQFTDTHLRAS